MDFTKFVHVLRGYQDKYPQVKTLLWKISVPVLCHRQLRKINLLNNECYIVKELLPILKQLRREIMRFAAL